MRFYKPERRYTLQERVDTIGANSDQHIGVKPSRRRLSSSHPASVPQQVAHHVEEPIALGGILSREQLLALVDGNERRQPGRSLALGQVQRLLFATSATAVLIWTASR